MAEKKEKKFNSERTSKMIKASLNEVFPNEKTFVVNTLVDKVEVFFPSTIKVPSVEINTFKSVFCTLAKIQKEELAFYQYERKEV